MHHKLPIDKLGPNGRAMAEAVQACVHCGFCLPACPTYRELGHEADSPRGRIYLMKGVMEGVIDQRDAQPHIDRCLSCLACETACPSGVAYHKLISPFRSLTEPRRPHGVLGRLRRRVLLRTLSDPRRFRIAIGIARAARWATSVMPRSLRPMFDLLPDGAAKPEPIATSLGAIGPRRARVALLLGCAQRVLEPGINAATIAVLRRNGAEVVLPRGQGCCGALAWHSGAGDMARELARANLDAFDPNEVDAVVTNAAGCGSAMREYPLILAGTERADAAARLAQRSVDVSVFLDRLGFIAPPALPEPLTVAYHDACHLLHGQRVRDEPRRLLGAVGNLTVVDLPDSELCCGSAGVYNIEQPQIAASLGDRKAGAIAGAGPDLVATGNIGCMMQIRAALKRAGSGVAVGHTMQVLADAYAGRLGARPVSSDRSRAS